MRCDFLLKYFPFLSSIILVCFVWWVVSKAVTLQTYKEENLLIEFAESNKSGP